MRTNSGLHTAFMCGTVLIAAFVGSCTCLTLLGKLYPEPVPQPTHGYETLEQAMTHKVETLGSSHPRPGPPSWAETVALIGGMGVGAFGGLAIVMGVIKIVGISDDDDTNLQSSENDYQPYDPSPEGMAVAAKSQGVHAMPIPAERSSATVPEHSGLPTDLIEIASELTNVQDWGRIEGMFKTNRNKWTAAMERENANIILQRLGCRRDVVEAVIQMVHAQARLQDALRKAQAGTQFNSEPSDARKVSSENKADVKPIHSDGGIDEEIASLRFALRRFPTARENLFNEVRAKYPRLVAEEIIRDAQTG